MFPDSRERNRKGLSLSGPRKCSGKITPDTAAITSPLCPWLFSGLPEQKRPISEGMSLPPAAHKTPQRLRSAGLWVPWAPRGAGWLQPCAGSWCESPRAMCREAQHDGNGWPHPPVSWSEPLLSAGDERRQGERASGDIGAVPQPQQVAPALSTVLHVSQAPGAAPDPGSLSKGWRIIAEHLMAVAVPAALLSLSPVNQPWGHTSPA